MYLNEAHNQREKDDLAMLIEEELRQSYLGVKNEEGVYITPAFPKVIYVLQEDNIHEEDKYWYLTEMAAKCSMKRLTPDYISEKIMKEMKDGNCYPVMGCRSALTVWHDENGKPKFYGRFNSGVVTVSLPDIALSSGGDYVEQSQMLLLFFGNTEHLQDLKRVNQLTNYFLVAIQLYPLVMQDLLNALSI